MTSQELKAALALLDDGNAWTQGGLYAVNKNGNSEDPISPDAVKFCAYGACFRVLGISKDFSFGLPSGMRVLDEFANGKSVTGFNDTAYSFEPVKQMFEKAIAKLVAEEARNVDSTER
jgi:hypothetical protein